MKCTPCDAVEGSLRIQVDLGGAGSGRPVDKYENAVGVIEVIAGNKTYKVAQQM